MKRNPPAPTILPSGDSAPLVDNVPSSSQISNFSSSSGSLGLLDSNSSDLDYVPEQTVKPQPKNKTINPDSLMDGDRFGLSNLALSKFIEKESGHKYTAEGVRKARQKLREKSGALDFSDEFVSAIGFDEKIDKCLQPDRSYKNQENVSVVLYPKEIHAGFFSPPNGTASALALALYQFCLSIKVNFQNVVGLVSDGCLKMTGYSGGAHVCFERLVGTGGRELQRVICFFHHLERVFSAMFEHWGGSTTGPSSLEAPWNTLLSDSFLKGFNRNFTPIFNPWLLQLLNMQMTGIKLSKDHQIFLDLCKIICSGDFYDYDSKTKRRILARVLNKKIGKLVASRFTTTECRCLRAYLAARKPPKKLQKVVEFIILVWAPVFILSKQFPKKHFIAPKLMLLEIILANKYLSKDEKVVVKNSLSNNGHMAAHENIFMCLLSSPFEEERIAAVLRILTIRTLKTKEIDDDGNVGDVNIQKAQKLRTIDPKFHLMINMKAKSIFELNMIPISQAENEPPVTKSMSFDELISVLKAPIDLELPITSVAVERSVKDTSRVHKMAGTHEQRLGMLQNSISSRRTDRKSGEWSVENKDDLKIKLKRK